MFIKRAPRPRRLQMKFSVWLACLILQTLVLLCFTNVLYVRFMTEKASLEEVLEPFGCKSANWSECQQIVSRYAERRQVHSHQIASRRDIAIERARHGPAEYDNIRVFRKNHPALVPLDPRYTPSLDWDVDVAIPDIAIVGLAKAGTTQLFRVLTSHPNATNFVEGHKEFCLPYELYETFENAWDDQPVDTKRLNPTVRQSDAQKMLYEFHESNFFSEPEQMVQPKTQLTVNGCYHNWDTEITRHYLLPFAKKRDQKYIVLFRDPADLLWSAFNFWKIPGLDPGDLEEGWAEEGEDYRSPELFHELVLAGNMTYWWGHEIKDYYRQESVRNPRKLLGMFGADNVLFLRNEDMLPSVVAKKRGALDRVSDFTGLDRDGFAEYSYSNVANCNDKAMQNCGESRSSAYRIAGNREMLPESRTLIYLIFLEECKIWKRDFGIEYPDCLNVLEKTKKHKQ